MNIKLLLLLVIAQQVGICILNAVARPDINFIKIIPLQSATNASATESFSQLVQLHQYAETQLTNVKTMFATLMENVALQQKQFSNELRSKTTAYLDEEIKKLDSSTIPQSDTIKTRISDCADDVNDVIDMGITQFVNILDDAERMVYELEDKLQTEHSSDDIDEINDEVDDILDDFKVKVETVVIPLVDDLLRNFKNKLVTLPSDLKVCVDEILN